MVSKYDLANDWLPRYTGMPVDQFGDYVLLTNSVPEYAGVVCMKAY